MANSKSDDAERKVLLRQAYGTATQRLRENHRDEFNKLYSEASTELGVEWAPRRTPEQKAEDAFDQLLRDYPHLAERTQSTA